MRGNKLTWLIQEISTDSQLNLLASQVVLGVVLEVVHLIPVMKFDIFHARWIESEVFQLIFVGHRLHISMGWLRVREEIHHCRYAVE